jgi:N-methylhydantoinase A/oxoprolinase/acetone carboxylase beta subunit
MTSGSPAPRGGWSVGIDIGGTFTDVIAIGPRGSVVLKVASTPGNPSDAVAAALSALSEKHGISPRDITRFAHGTTVATNAVIERKGARVGLIATEGFRDILEIGRQMRRQMYDLHLQPETPGWLAPGERRVEVRERIDAHGDVVVPLDEDSIDAALEKLRPLKVEAIAISLLFSFLDPSHEQRVRVRVQEVLPGVDVSISSEVDPAFREYERTVVTAFDAYIKPVVDRYLANLAKGLAASGVPAPLQVMQSRGGLAGVETARQRPVRLFLSGPAAGAIGSAAVGKAEGFEDLITVDVGGTSSDIALVEGGTVHARPETQIAGYAVRVPMLDVTTLGAGGGSIAWIDAGGGLRVGPHSAGSDPGPACYGRGGRLPTVTDASVVLGYLDTSGLAGGAVGLEPALAYSAIEETIARPLGIDVVTAALGIHRITNGRMADGVRLVSVNRGHDPRRFVLLPLGGAGGLHATAVADELSIARILVPRYPGVLAAAGLLTAPISHEVAGAFHGTFASTELSDVRREIAVLDRRADDLMRQEAVEGLSRQRTAFADVGYVGQSHFIEVPLDAGSDDALSRLYTDFEAKHTQLNGHKTGAPAKIVNLRVVHSALLTESRIDRPAAQAPEPVRARVRSVRFSGSTGPTEAVIHQRSALKNGDRIVGPAIIGQSDSTTLVPPAWSARVLASGALLMERT